jgi:3-oxoadipate CoA-transferase beta subunit
MSALTREQMAWRAAQDVPDGAVVNLGMGIPVMVPDHLPADREVIFQSENGVIGVGRVADGGEADPDLVDASSRRVTLASGATIVDSAASFAMIRGGHVDITVLGAFEVAANGDLANWNSRVPDKGPLVGGAMDLATGSRQTWAIMAHNTRDGAPRLLQACTLPLTARSCVTRVYTDIAVMDVVAGAFLVREMVEGVDAATLRARTDGPVTIADDCAVLRAP